MVLLEAGLLDAGSGRRGYITLVLVTQMATHEIGEGGVEKTEEDKERELYDGTRDPCMLGVGAVEGGGARRIGGRDGWGVGCVWSRNLEV